MADAATTLANRISELVEEHWHEHNRPLLLSQLGTADQGDVGKSAKQLAPNLAGFIRGHVAGVRIVSGSTVPPIFAVLPANIGQEVDVDDLLAEKRRERASVRVRRFLPAFWAAFRVPLDESKRRFVSIRAPARFQDAPLDETDRSSFVEVQRQYITTGDADDTVVQQRISEWLQRHELDDGPFLVANRPATDLPHDDLLGRLLVSLEPEELKRMSIPLDVVLKLRRQSL